MDTQTAVTYLGVSCQNCGEIIPVPGHLVNRQIMVAEDPYEPRDRYVSTLLNLRCRACHREYFYDVEEITQVEGTPRSYADGMPRRHRHVSTAHHHRYRPQHQLVHA